MSPAEQVRGNGQSGCCRLMIYRCSRPEPGTAKHTSQSNLFCSIQAYFIAHFREVRLFAITAARYERRFPSASSPCHRNPYARSSSGELDSVANDSARIHGEALERADYLRLWCFWLDTGAFAWRKGSCSSDLRSTPSGNLL